MPKKSKDKGKDVNKKPGMGSHEGSQQMTTGPKKEADRKNG